MNRQQVADEIVTALYSGIDDELLRKILAVGHSHGAAIPEGLALNQAIERELERRKQERETWH